MSETADSSLPSTPESVKAIAQTDVAAPAGTPPAEEIAPCEGDGILFVINESVKRVFEERPKERDSSQPIYRPLKIFALDPSVSRLEGATAVVKVPYEPLAPGPCGYFFKVENSTEGAGPKPERPLLSLDDHDILINNGLDPSTADERFHEQMVYAICSVVHTAFRTGLGRQLVWGFNKPPDRTQLLIKPRAFQSNNSHYDREAGELCFGFYKSQAQDTYPGTVFACLSHDTVAHEVTHALLDGLRAHFSLPMSADVVAFHEGFADLVALFQHFSYEQVVRTAIRKSRGDLSRADLLTDIARQLGMSRKGSSSALRSAIDYASEQSEHAAEGKKRVLRVYDSSLNAHDLGSVLVFAVFEAFINVYRRKTERLLRLATGGTGRLRAGEISADLQTALAEKASKLASQFLTMCIRAIDYCPPVDMTFGQYLRAVITADKDLVPDDTWAYREAWVDAFRRYKIFPNSVPDLSEESLLWRSAKQLKTSNPAEPKYPEIKELSFFNLRFDGDPGWPASKAELHRQACELGKAISKPELLGLFGLTANGDRELKREIDLDADEVELPKIQSIRSSRRIGPSGQVVFDLVAEVTQLRRAHVKGSNVTCNFYGGSTIIIDPQGEIRYVIAKRVTNNLRLQQQIEFLNKPQGAQYKDSFYGQVSSQPNFFMMLHKGEPQSNSENEGPIARLKRMVTDLFPTKQGEQK
jgi:hypothetical protein